MTIVTNFLGGWSLDCKLPPIFCAEIGTFFNKDIRLACKMLEHIALVRDRVPHQPLLLKGEILHNPAICLPGDTVERYADKNGIIHEEPYDALIARKTLSLDAYHEILDRAKQLGFSFALSVYDEEGAVFAKNEGCCCLKIASSNIVHYPLLQAVCRLDLPVLLDDGRASLAEVATAVRLAQEYGAPLVLLEHSPDGHPALPELHNLRMLQTYASTFGIPVGLSDHYVGEEMLYVATALGAKILEKGIVLDAALKDQDVSHALPVERLEHVLCKISDCHKALGAPMRSLQAAADNATATSARMAIVAKRVLQKGSVLTAADVTFAFPRNDGIGVEHWHAIEGSVIMANIPAMTRIRWQDIHKTTC